MSEKSKSYESASIKNLGKSQTEITGSIASSAWEKFRAQALKNLNESISIDGFRKGMIPENILVSKVGEMSVLEEIAELAVSKAYVDILIDNKIDAIGKPAVKVTKLAKDNPIEFTATTSVVPEVTLPDYKKLSKEAVNKSSENENVVTDKDMDDAILRLRKSRVSHEGHDHGKMTPEEHEKKVMDSLPELNDSFVQSLGDFKDVTDFKEKLQVILTNDKKDQAREKARIRIADALTDATKIEIPDIIIKGELNRIEAQFRDDIERMGVKLEDYLKHAKKSLEDLHKDWQPHAEKKAKLQLILNSISQKENLKPDLKEIEAEVDHILEHHKDADRERASVYAETVLTNEKVFQFLEQ